MPVRAFAVEDGNINTKTLISSRAASYLDIDLAVWWKDSVKFEKMILSYDTYNPNKTDTVQIIVIMPEFAAGSYKASYVNLIETRFNNFVQSTNELVECI